MGSLPSKCLCNGPAHASAASSYQRDFVFKSHCPLLSGLLKRGFYLIIIKEWQMVIRQHVVMVLAPFPDFLKDVPLTLAGIPHVFTHFQT
jgi:hypothetical protein